jgi:hypothetical protein
MEIGLGYLSRYSDSQRIGRFGDRITVEARFYAPVQTGAGSTLPSVKLVKTLFTGSVVAGP